MSSTYNIVHTHGDSFSLRFTVQTNGVGWNLTDYTADFSVSRSTSSTTNLLELSSPDDISLSSVGVVTIVASAADMSNLSPGNFTWRVVLTSPGNEVTTILSGRFLERQV